MKAIKGLEDRLYALDQMIASCGRLVNEQKELAQVLISNFSQEKEFVAFPCKYFYVQCQFGIHHVFTPLFNIVNAVLLFPCNKEDMFLL